MIRLVDYIFENLEESRIDEASIMGDSARHNWDHDTSTGNDYIYAIAVLNILLGNSENTMDVDKISLNGNTDELNIDLTYNNNGKGIKLNNNTYNNIEAALKEILRSLENDNDKNYSYKDFDAIINQISNNKKSIWCQIDKYPFTKKDVSTRDQEVATCLIFNHLVKEKFDFSNITLNINKKQIKETELFSIISNLCENLDGNFDNTWKISFYYQIAAITKLIKDNNCNPNDFVLERYDGDSKQNWKLSKNYANVIKQYTAKFPGSSKDNWDPTDIILYKKNAIDDIEKILTNAKNQIKTIIVGENGETDNSNFKTEFMKLYNGIEKNPFIFRGLSLKKLSNKPEIESFNIVKKTELKINEVQLINVKQGTKTIQEKYHETAAGAYIIFNAKLYLNGSDEIINKANINNPEDSKPIAEDKDVKRFKLSIRTNGKTICCDLSLCKEGSNTTGPSLGKCAVAIWRKELNISESDSKHASQIKGVINQFKKELNLEDKPNIKKIDAIAESAIKCGPACLPFIIIH